MNDNFNEIVDSVTELVYNILKADSVDKVRKMLDDNGTPGELIEDILCEIYEENPDDEFLEEIIGDEYGKRFMKAFEKEDK